MIIKLTICVLIAPEASDDSVVIAVFAVTRKDYETDAVLIELDFQMFSLYMLLVVLMLC